MPNMLTTHNAALDAVDSLYAYQDAVEARNAATARLHKSIVRCDHPQDVAGYRNACDAAGNAVHTAWVAYQAALAAHKAAEAAMYYPANYTD